MPKVELLETRKIADPAKPGDFIVINARDFDPATMTPFEGPEPDPVPERLAAMDKAALVAELAEHGVEHNKNLGPVKLRELLAAALAGG